MTESTESTQSTDAADDEVEVEVEVLPWWHNPVNLIAMLIGVLVLAGGAGFVIGERNATPDPNQVDIGFLQDMRAHHEQAVEMGLTFLSTTGSNQTVALIAARSRSARPSTAAR